jgi:CPA2 family monovalent cation:H+ antiporter-2
LLAPLRDLFAAVFFVFFGLSTDPSVLPAVVGPVVALTVVTGVTKGIVAWVGGARERIGARGRRRAAAALLARGEFSIVIAGLGVAAGGSGRLSAIAAGYVLLTATIGPIAARVADRREVGARSAHG